MEYILLINSYKTKLTTNLSILHHYLDKIDAKGPKLNNICLQIARDITNLLI